MHPQGNQQDEKTEGVFPATTVSTTVRLVSLTPLTDQQLRLCGLCDAGCEASRHHDVRVAIRRTPPFDQEWCVAPFNHFRFSRAGVCSENFLKKL